ncbi:MAG: ATP-binding protein [Deltaproteobacteria bacterium]
MDAFNAILQRVGEKQEDYATYGFDKREMAALNTFFDLAQEYDSLENIYLVSVIVPRIFLALHCNLYLVHPKTDVIEWVASGHPDLTSPGGRVPDYVKIADAPYRHELSYVVPIHGKKTPSSHILFSSSRDVIGIFEVVRADQLAEGEFFFIQKYVNRIGYNLYNKLLAEQNIQHLKFINSLVADIEHNVIVPNIRYKHYFRKIRKYLNVTKDMEGELDTLLEKLKSHDQSLYAEVSETLERMIVFNRSFFKDQQKIEEHYKHTSLFLESLFRPDHFLFGEYILRKTRCLFCRDIVRPQLERYKGEMAQRGIIVDPVIQAQDVTEDRIVRVDKGLMAQVIANLFSNAAKYTKPVVDASGKKSKRVECKMSVLEDFFGRGHRGVRFHIFSSGPPIGRKDSSLIFEEGFRVTEGDAVQGKGHGLHFVRNVVEVHGGVVGHNAHELGNEFYFVIPT